MNLWKPEVKEAIQEATVKKLTPIQTDYIYAFYKVGDQPSPEGKKDGDLICYVDPQDYNPVISDWTKTVFAILKTPRISKGSIKLSIENKERINFSELESKTGIVGLEASLRGKHKTGIIDINGTRLKYTKKLNPKVKDLNAITSGDHTYGSAGNYTLLSLATADLGDMIAKLTLTQISATVETGTSTIAINTNGFELLITSNNKPKGNPGAGWITSVNANVTYMTISTTAAGSNVRIEHLNVDHKSNAGNFVFFNFAAITGNMTGTINNCILRSTAAGEPIGIQVNDSNALVCAYRNGLLSLGYGTYVISARAGTIFENNTITNATVRGYWAGGANDKYINNVSMGSGVDFFNIAGSTGKNNASADATAANGNWLSGSENLSGLTTTNEMISTANDDWNAGKIKDSSLNAAGTTPTITENTTGIRGNNVPNPPSIGADEYAAGINIEYEIGAEGDFNTFADAVISLPAVFTGLPKLKAIENVSETTAPPITANMGAFGITIDGNGYTVTLANGVWFPYFTTASGSGTIDVCNMKYENTGAGRALTMVAGVAFTGTVYFRHNIFDGGGNSSDGIVIQDNSPVIKCYNNIFKNGRYGIVITAATNANNKWENNTIYNNSVGAILNGDLPVTYSNNALFGNAVNFVSAATSTTNNCGTDKTTIGGAVDNNPQVNRILLTEFEDATKFKIRNTGTLYNNGQAVTIAQNTTGIYGNLRPDGDGNYSIGASQWATYSNGIFFRKYW